MARKDELNAKWKGTLFSGEFGTIDPEVRKYYVLAGECAGDEIREIVDLLYERFRNAENSLKTIPDELENYLWISAMMPDTERFWKVYEIYQYFYAYKIVGTEWGKYANREVTNLCAFAAMIVLVYLSQEDVGIMEKFGDMMVYFLSTKDMEGIEQMIWVVDALWKWWNEVMESETGDWMIYTLIEATCSAIGSSPILEEYYYKLRMKHPYWEEISDMENI